jgi:hypothetical protein
MASESVLKELYQVARVSTSFKGISDADVWKACLQYKDRSDGDIRIAMSNIQKKDQEVTEKAQEGRQKIEKGKEKIISLHQEEAGDRQKDERNADEILANLFN